MSDYIINHCGLVAEIQEKMTSDDFKELVITRAGQIVQERMNGKSFKKSKLKGVEVVAQHLAADLVEGGAKAITDDLDVNLDEMKELVKSNHISSC